MSTAVFSKAYRAHAASVMPQVLAVWCEQLGHKVHLAYYNGYEVMAGGVPEDVDIVFIGAFTHSAMVAYAMSEFFRSKGVVTVLGGPHARAYPEDAAKYFDYVTGLTDQSVLKDILDDRSHNNPGVCLKAKRQPATLPSLRERWKFIELLLPHQKLVQSVSTLGSLGCPYTCSFCCDSVVQYQPLDFDQLRDDLIFVRQAMKRPVVTWHDPNFGVRFNEYLDLIEETVPPGSISFLAESSLSLLTETNLARLKKNGFFFIAPGVESWYEVGNKSKVGRRTGEEKVRRVAEHCNLILRYVPSVQVNFLFGLDSDEGAEPFELTKMFLKLCPGVLPVYSLLTAFGRSAPLNLEYQKDDRIVPVPFHFLNGHHAMNVRPKNYTWPELYRHAIDLWEATYSYPAIWRRARANGFTFAGFLNLIRGIDLHSARVFRRTLKELETPAYREFMEQESSRLPFEFVEPVKKDLGPLYRWLPEGALYHDPKAYLNSLVPS